MIKNLLLNKFYIASYLYRKQFKYCGKGVKVYLPYLALSKKNISISDRTEILPGARIQSYISNGKNPNIIIGKNCYFSYNLSILAGDDIAIDDYVLIASNVLITSETHGMDPLNEIPYMDQPLSVKSVHIKQGCWIGEKVCILPGVTIGEKSIIGAGSIVTKSIPDYCIAVGNPAKVIKKYNFEKKNWEKYNGE